MGKSIEAKMQSTELKTFRVFLHSKPIPGKAKAQEASTASIMNNNSHQKTPPKHGICTSHTYLMCISTEIAAAARDPLKEDTISRLLAA